MREAAALLPADDPVRKALIWADMELGDRYDQICELEEENDTLSDQYAELVHAMQNAKDVLESVTKGIHSALWQPELPPVDHAPFINCMAAQGVAPYAKAKRKPKVVTT
jgi:hypothetical protein